MSDPGHSLILIADDDRDTRRLFERFLQSTGYRVLCVDSGRKAVALARSLKPDLILLDVMMPDLDGYGVCAQLQADAATSFMPVVFVTGLAAEQDRARAFAVGAADFLSKPCGKPELLRVVERNLGAFYRWAEVRRSTELWGSRPLPEKYLQFRGSLPSRLRLSDEAERRLTDLPAHQLYDLTRYSTVTEAGLARHVAEAFGLNFLPALDPTQIQLGVLPPAFCRQQGVVPLRLEDGQNGFALSNPFAWEQEALGRVDAAFGGSSYQLVVAPPGVIASLFEAPELAAGVPAEPRAVPEPERTRRQSLEVLVVGGTRFVGYLLTWRLLAAGHRVTLFNRGTLADPFGDRVERLTGDRTTADFDRLLAGRRFDATVDFAAYEGRDVEQVVRTLGPAAGHYVLISTGQVYLIREGCPRPAREKHYDGPVMGEPDDPRERGDWLYGIGKRAAEDALVRAWAESRFPATRLRIPMVNGERDYYRRIESYLWRLLDGGPILLPDGGKNVCRHVYGADVARTVSDLLGTESTFGQAYNLCQEEEPTLAELIGELGGLLGSRPRMVPVPAEELAEHELIAKEISPFSGRYMSHLDPSRAREELGFRATPLREYLGRIVASFLANPPADRPENYQHRERELCVAGAH